MLILAPLCPLLLCRLEAAARGVPLRVSTITPAAIHGQSFRTGAAGNKTPASPPSARPEVAAAAAPAAEGAAATGGQQQPAAALHAQDIVAAVLFCLSAPDCVDVCNVTVRAVRA